MKLLSLVLCLFIFFSCSTPLSELWSDADPKERNEKLITEDFKLEDDVLSKFSEKKEPEIKKAKTEKKIIQKKSSKISKKKKGIPTKVRKAIRPTPPKRKLKKQVTVVKSRYPENFPQKLIDFDVNSKKYWDNFSPHLFHGESMTMNISYMGISTGTMVISTQNDTRLGETDVHHISARMKTSSYYSYLYEIDDIADTYVKKQEFVPLKFSLIQRQSDQNIDDLQLFDRSELKTYSFYKRVTKKKNSKKKKIKEIPFLFQDPLSVLYFIRGLPMQKGTRYVIPIVNQGKVEVLIAGLEKIETIDTNIGKKKAYRLNINSKAKGKTIKGGNMTFWFSADSKRVFLKFKAKIKIGSISGDIESYKE